MKFEWDEEKNNLNKKKHGISFETAINVFADPMRIELFDDAHSEFEERWLTIGMVYPSVMVVIHLFPVFHAADPPREFSL